MKKVNWINSWRKGNKKNKVEFTLRIGLITVVELYWNPGKELKFLLLNCGIQL